MPLSVNWSSASVSFVRSIHYLPMGGSWLGPAPKTLSFATFVITYIRSVIRLVFPLVSSHTSFDTPMPQKCFAPVHPPFLPHFLGALLRANSCARQLRSFCF